MKSNAMAVGLAVLGVVFLVVAALYEFGVLQIAVSDPSASHHPTHAILFTVLAVASFIGANFTREKTV